MFYHPELNKATIRPRIKNVSNPSDDTIYQKGWIDLVDEIPEYNPETHFIQVKKIRVEGGKAYREFEVVSL